MVERKEYTTGAMIDTWGNGAQNLTFIVTEDCNLRCKYCYVTHKTKGKRLDIETAKKFIDYILTTEQIVKPEAVVLDFIGGEPLLEAELIEEICDYFKIRAYEEGVSWYWNYRINISTNGINYDDEKVQRLIKKNEDKISIGITIDGTKEKHDLQRVFPDGSGSYNAVYRNIKLWLQQFPGSTKVTFASEDLKFLKESIIHLWNEGIYDIAANVVYEDVWKPGDDLIFETQLKELADYIIENELYNKYRCTLFLDFIGIRFVPVAQIGGNGVHGARTVQADQSDDIFKVLGLQAHKHLFHAGGFQLEHTLGIALPQHFIGIRVVIIQLADGELRVLLLHGSFCIPDDGQGAQPQKVHLQKTQLFDLGHVELGHRQAVVGGKRQIIIRRLRRNDHACRVGGGVPGHALHLQCGVDEFGHLRVGIVELFQLAGNLQCPLEGHFQFHGHKLCYHVHLLVPFRK